MEYCDPYYEKCPSGLGGWIETHQTPAIIIGILLVLILICIAGWIVSYRKRPFCADCGNVRTKYVSDNKQPICYDCNQQRKMEAEDKLDCPFCKTKMVKEEGEMGIIIDVCPNDGAVVLSADELRAIRDKVSSDQASASTSNAIMMSMVASSMSNCNSGSSC